MLEGINVLAVPVLEQIKYGIVNDPNDKNNVFTYPDEKFEWVIWYRYRNNKWYKIDYKDLYQVSNYGRIWSVKRNIFLKCRIKWNGRCEVALTKDNKITYCLVHRIVLFAFKGLPKYWFYETRHLDNNPQNNNLNNLEWGHKKKIIKIELKMEQIIEGQIMDKRILQTMI